MRIAPILVPIALGLVACASATDANDNPDEAALSTAATFVLASATTPTCVLPGATDVPLGVGACDASPELTFDASTSEIRLASNPSQCLDVRYANKAPGAEVMFHGCHGLANQTWRIANDLPHASHLAGAVRVQAYASEPGVNLCLAAKNGRLLLDTCASNESANWSTERRVGDRLARRGKIVTSLLTFGMIESPTNADRAVADRSTSLPDAAARLAVEVVKRVMPRVGPSETPRVLLVLDDANQGEQAGDAAQIAQALTALLTRTQARLQVDIQAGVEISTTKIEAIIEDELQHLSVSITEKRSVVRLLVSTTLVMTTTKAKVELVNEPSAGLTFDGLRMSDGKPPHVVWLSNPGQPIDDQTTVDALLRFAQRGGGVVVQGDDAAQNTAKLTGLALRGSWGEANGHAYCGQSWDNGSAKYPLSSLGLDGLVYTDDLDLAKVVDPTAQVLAYATPVCHGQTERLPAVVLLPPDPESP